MNTFVEGLALRNHQYLQTILYSAVLLICSSFAGCRSVGYEEEWGVIKNEHFFFNASENLRFVDFSTHDSRIYCYEHRLNAYKIMFDLYSRDDSSQVIEYYLSLDQASLIELTVDGVRSKGVAYHVKDDLAYPYQLIVFKPDTPEVMGADMHGSARTKAGCQELLRIISTVRFFQWLRSSGPEE